MKYWLAILLITICYTRGVYSQDVLVLQKIIDEVKSEKAPDSRTSVYSVRVKPESGRYVLSGEILGEKIHQELLSRINESTAGKNTIRDDIRVLPAKSLQDKIYGLINLSVANIRTRPAESAEMATQALLGTLVQIVDMQNGWLRIQTPDRYIGWATQSSLIPLDEKNLRQWGRSSKIMYRNIYGFAYSAPDSSGSTVSDLTAGNMLEAEDMSGKYYRVQYPDGRKAYVLKSESIPFDLWKRTTRVTEESIVYTARRFMGIPYLWGGTSPKGMDCSGFTKMVYFLNGVILSRDASQQVNEGSPVDIRSGYRDVHPGDLLFFGEKASAGKNEKVVHVAISLGGMEFIHASGCIRVSSLDPKSPVYDEFNANRILRVKRLISNNIIHGSVKSIDP